MTRRAGVLDALEPGPTASLNAADLARLGVAAGERIRVTSRRGSVELTARQDNGTPPGAVFIPFAYAEASATAFTQGCDRPDPCAQHRSYGHPGSSTTHLCAHRIGRCAQCTE